MVKTPFYGIDDLADFIYYLADEQGKFVYAVMFYDEAKKLLQSMLNIEGVEIDSIELLDPLYDGYDKEYYISFSNDYKISVEKANHNDIYYRFGTGDDTVVLLQDNVDKKIIEVASYGNLFQIEMCEIEDDDFDYFDDECETEMYEIDYDEIMEYVLYKLLED